MRLTTLGPVRYSIKNENGKKKRKKKPPSRASLTDEGLVQSPDMNMKRSGNVCVKLRKNSDVTARELNTQ